jgi:hypothetical protein
VFYFYQLTSGFKLLLKSRKISYKLWNITCRTHVYLLLSFKGQLILASYLMVLLLLDRRFSKRFSKTECIFLLFSVFNFTMHFWPDTLVWNLFNLFSSSPPISQMPPPALDDKLRSFGPFFRFLPNWIICRCFQLAEKTAT